MNQQTSEEILEMARKEIAIRKAQATEHACASIKSRVLASSRIKSALSTRGDVCECLDRELRDLGVSNDLRVRRSHRSPKQ